MRGTATPEAGMSAEEPVHGLASSEPGEDEPKVKTMGKKGFSNTFRCLPLPYVLHMFYMFVCLWPSSCCQSTDTFNLSTTQIKQHIYPGSSLQSSPDHSVTHVVFIYYYFFIYASLPRRRISWNISV